MMKIYGDSNSGNCLKVKWVCDRLALPYSWIEMNIMKGETRTPEFLKRNGAGQVPTVEFDDGRALAQSNAIIRYSPVAATSFPPMPLPQRRWMNGCSGSNSATSPISRTAGSRWFISASPPPIWIPIG
jgi:glutathione S-transferase